MRPKPLPHGTTPGERVAKDTRYHASLDNAAPADAYFGRAADILRRRARIKRQTIEHRRLQHRKFAA